MFRRRIRHLQRYREIAMAFSRNGFGYFVEELGLYSLLSLPKRILARSSEEIHMKTTGERLRMFMEELGPTFVKLGQIASTRQDLFTEDIIMELEKLQDQVPPFSFEEAKGIIESELHEKLEYIFKEFHEEPIAAASIGQVHYAVLLDGREVAVKVQRPGIERRVDTDLEILKDLAHLAVTRTHWGQRYQVEEIVDEFAQSLTAELDYTLEGRNMHKISQQFRNDPTVRMPEVYWDYTADKVLTMEFITGINLDEVGRLAREGYDMKQLAHRVVESLFHQILIEGFFHADPHPGNVMALPGNKILYMDFGMVGRLTPDMKDQFTALIIAMMRQSTSGVIKAITRMGIVPDDVSMRRLRIDVDQLREKYYDVPFSQLSIGEAVNDLFRVSTRHNIKLPTDLTLVGKAILSIEGTVERLDPDISIVQIAEPFGRKLLKERYSPNRLAEDAFEKAVDYKDVVSDFPEHVQTLYGLIRKGKLPLEISVGRVEIFLRKLDRISNRISFSIVLLSFSIIMVSLIIGSAISGTSSYLWNLPVIEIGFVVAIGMFGWIVYSIFKSGRF